MLSYQVDKYAREKGANPERITPAQRDALMEEMITKKYPGKSLEYCLSMNMNNVMPIRGRISFHFRLGCCLTCHSEGHNAS